MDAAAEITSNTVTNEGWFRANLEALHGIVAHCVGHDAASLRGHIEVTRAIEITPAYYGEHVVAAHVAQGEAVKALCKMLDAQIELERHRAELRAKWQKHLDEFRQHVIVQDSAIHPSNGPNLVEALHTLENSKVSKEMYGDLLDQAEQVRTEGIVNYKVALRKIALLVVDPASVPDESKVPVEVLELVLMAFREMALPEDVFGDDLARARELHAQSVAKQEALIARMKTAGDDQDAINAARAREQAAAEERLRGAVQRSPEEAKARNARIEAAAQASYEAVQRLTEACQLDDAAHVGTINSPALVELIQACQGLVARVEGRLQ